MGMFNLFGFESANINTYITYSTLSQWTSRGKKSSSHFLNLFFTFVDQDFNFTDMNS